MMKPFSLRSLLIINLLLPLLIATSCNKKFQLIKISGNTQGTTYTITYYSADNIDLQPEIEKILNDFENSLSIYRPNSIVSRINSNDSAVIVDDYFITVFKKSMEISQATNGAFDITVGPLVNAWGFGFKNKIDPDSNKIKELRRNVDFRMVNLIKNRIIKAYPEISLDFNAIAQGYTVDIIAKFLENKNIQNYLVEIGGEIKAKGKKEDGKCWTIGIEEPSDNNINRNLKATMQLCDKALATSGNYRKFYIKDGIKYSHTIDPKTGYPVQHSLLSASVFAESCMEADAYATAFMVMGMEKATQFIEKHPELDVYFIYADANGKLKTLVTKNLEQLINEN